MFLLVRPVVLSLSIMTYCMVSHGEKMFMTFMAEMIPHTDGWVLYAHHGWIPTTTKNC